MLERESDMQEDVFIKYRDELLPRRLQRVQETTSKQDLGRVQVCVT